MTPPGHHCEQVMFFPFTFTMSVPGIMNPFTGPPYLIGGTTDSRNIAIVSKRSGGSHWLIIRIAHIRPPCRRPNPLPGREGGSPLAQTKAAGEGQGVEMADDLPPAKRRRTLAGTIVSGAVNAALIGTAVGLTVYRLWKDRGKVPELEPPPYEQGDWVHTRRPNTMRRGTTRHRRVRTQVKMPVTPPRLSRHPSPQRPTKIGSDLDQADDLEDRMDWMGGRLAQLIEDGKKALGKEIVVMSEVQEDEEDDGNGNWEEEADPDASIAGPSRSSSVRRESDWQSSELRKTMERARATYLQSRQ
ncbi:hypothetical protein BJV77DRAFT_1002420 [Russula vinacea]|nr:hypothetical protein BJV77DRAFT_1002420 [Russula vinacea]